MHSNYESSPEPPDRTLLLWGGVLLAFVIMIGALAFSSGGKVTVSRVKAQHILIKCNMRDPRERSEAIDLIEDLRGQINEGGADFSQLARDNSQDPQSSFRGGLLGWAEKGVYEDAFDEFVWSGEIGTVSSPIETSYGFHLIKILDRQDSEADLHDAEIRKRALQGEEPAAVGQQ
jgi:peptidyl-prolyl cis-trans isomerase SurA